MADENLAHVVSVAREYSDDLLLQRLEMCIRRLRETVRSLAPEANITDRFEGIEAQGIAKVLKERHG